jgi:ribosomal protein L14E/L6E/L27E
METRLGQLVVSAAGRDRGRYYIVTQILDDTTVAVTDGAYRPVSNPKKKNVRHLMMTRTINSSLSEKLLQGIDITNEEVCEALKISSKAKSERTDCSDG